MTDKENKKPSTEPYKGVRDFYPSDFFIQKYLYELMRETAGQFGYEEYNASLLEPAELYELKSSQEILNEQTYTFTDRGNRRVTLRPEMTPTIARMVAKRRKELSLPLRWFSIVNVFRYEKPQRGRLREHVQLNVDIFGSSSYEAECEIIEMATALLYNAGASEHDFQIHISSKNILTAIHTACNIADEDRLPLNRILDAKKKMSESDFYTKVRDCIGDTAEVFISAIESETATRSLLQKHDPEALDELDTILHRLQARGITNYIFQPSLVRGFDYYTGVVFEIFDTNPENNRAMLGGGRYDRLLETFDAEATSAVGFGMGDVTLYDFLASRDCIPEYHSNADLALCLADNNARDAMNSLARHLRQTHYLHVRTDISGKKLTQQIKDADRSSIPFIICIGNQELQTNKYTLKHLASGVEHSVSKDEIPSAMDDIRAKNE